MDIQEEIQALRRELEQANYEYYVQDNPSMSDYDYDHKLRRLEELKGEHPELITPIPPPSGWAESPWSPLPRWSTRCPWSPSRTYLTTTSCASSTSG